MKKILTLLTILVMLVSILPLSAVASGETGIVFYNTADNSVVTSLDNLESVKATVGFIAKKTGYANVIAAHYNKNGVLKKTEWIESVESTAGVVTDYTTANIAVADTAILKIFVWDSVDTMVPLLDEPGSICRISAILRPTATVTKLDVSKIDTPLTFAMNFKADPASAEQLLAYGNWYADFVLTVNKDVTYNANGTADGYLAGQYDAWSKNWVSVPFESVKVEKNDSLKIMEYASKLMGKPGLKYTYKEVYNTVKDFDCGIFFDEEFLTANPDLTATLELRIYNPANESESYAIGDTYTFTAQDSENDGLPTATVTKLDVSKIDTPLTFAMNFKADLATEAQILKYGNWYADFVLTVNKDVTYNANGTADGYLAGQYDSWSENWVCVPFESVKVEKNDSLKIMEYASKLMGKPGLKYTYKEVYESVKDFDCGIFFDEEFLTANPDLTATLELRIYNPANESESYAIGDTYTFTVSGNDNTVTEEMNISDGEATAIIPTGVALKNGVDELSLSVTKLNESESGIETDENETLTSIDVHIDGVAKNNSVPMVVTVPNASVNGLNKGNIKLYHIEDGKTIEMTEVSSEDDLIAHNRYYYNPENGEIKLALASFSEVAIVTEDDKAWKGEYDTSWYDASKSEFKISNADQLAGFGQIVGRMAEEIKADSFEGKTVTLTSDINLNNKLFYPIGYYNSTGSYDKVSGVSVESNVSNFSGAFDGAGHTIANFYQNTWEMFGDYNNGYTGTPNHYDDAMGLFGYVVNGTVKNLTVDNFSSDGEFTPTGVIAAYAVNSTFENIALTNCNPRVYNTGNGGIVGIAGRVNDAVEAITLRNITVDNSNKISALWGSWDVACGGLVGMYRGNADADGKHTGDKISFENCHVAAQIDVYNDVCANYQYYAYRYAGMMIGSIRHNTTNTDGKTIPNMAGISATNCTVNYGDWNDYYYCEFEKNSMASYSEDYQFSRVDKSEIIFDEDGNITGCTHTHTDAEDKRAVYLPFHQLFTGYSWGVSSIGLKEYSGIVTDLGITEGDENESVEKFKKATTAKNEYTTETTLTIGELFATNDSSIEIKSDKVQVFVSPVGEDSKAGGIYEANTTDWTQGTITLTGIGEAIITITDYYFCTPTTIEIIVTEKPEEPTPVNKFIVKNDLQFKHTVEGGTIPKTLGDIFEADEGAEISSANVEVTVSNTTLCTYTKNASDWTQSTLSFTGTGEVTLTITDGELCNPATATVTVSNPTETVKFEKKFNKDFLYRVGNNGRNNETSYDVKLSDLFGVIGGKNVGEISAEIKCIAGNVEYAISEDTSLTEKTINFTGTGVVNVTIDDNTFTTPTELYLEVVDAKNITSAKGTTTGGNFVLLCDVNTTSYVYYWNSTLYGNGFTYSLEGAPTNYSSSHGHGILITQNATLDNVVIIGDVYSEYGAYSTQNDFNAAIDVINNTTIKNCYIANCSTPVKSRGDTTIIDTTLYGGTVANLIINSGTVTIENVTTVNYNDPERNVFGFGILISDNASDTAKLVLSGTLKQHNFISENDVTEMNNAYATEIFNSIFSDDYSNYHSKPEPKYVNTGIISISENFKCDSIEDKANTGYIKKDDAKLTLKDPNTGIPGDINGAIYSMPTPTTIDNEYVSELDSHKATIQGDYLPKLTSLDLGTQGISYEGEEDNRYLYGDKNGIKAAYTKDETPITIDLTKLSAIISKYTDQSYNNISVSCKDSSDTIIGTDTSVTLIENGTYTLVFTIEDTIFYNADGTILDKSIQRTFTVPLELTVLDAKLKDAVITINNPKQDGSYSGLTDKTITFNPLNAITISDNEENEVNLTTNIQSTNISYASNSNAFAGATTITITYNDGRILKIVLGKPSLNSPGSSKAITYSNDGTIKSAGAVASKSATGGTWTVTSYSFKGQNGKEITNDTVVTFTFPDKSCVTADTLVTLADGSQKRIDEVTYSDQLLVWDFFNGEYAKVPSSIIFYHGDSLYDVLSLNFEDGTTVKVINTHGFFDEQTNQFEFINESNVANYIGHNFIKADSNSYKSVKLISYDKKEEYTGCYSIQTAQHNNFITEGMFSLTIPHYEGWFDYFEIGKNMKYDEQKMNADIEKYGLYSYEELADYVTYEQFMAFNGPYLKVLVGRGVLTFEQILQLIDMYVNPQN